MDEVKTMSQAGEKVGRAMGTGLKAARVRTEKAAEQGIKVSKRALAKAEKKLAKRGLTPEKIQASVADTAEDLGKRGRKARKQLGKRSKAARKEFKAARKELHKTTTAAYKDLAAKFAKEQPKKRRRWPVVLLLLGGIGAAVATVLSKRPEQVSLHEEVEDQLQPPQQRTSSDNGNGNGGDGKHTAKPTTTAGAGGATKPGTNNTKK
ncbi:hypothetical protein GCM10022247_16580 [Allokutzneria multivorans]|uniref:Uncharacterized protein n=1 Tax=Allokutzneria multivorans TaxID=1142134 RepID=A0ABP7RGJ7_9PSEU